MKTRLVVILAVFTMLACSSRATIERWLANGGAEKLMSAADSLGASGGAAAGGVPEEAWPADIRALGPKAVRIGPEGVFIRMHSLFAQESGVYVASEGAKVEVGSGPDPAFELLTGRIYWYEIKG